MSEIRKEYLYTKDHEWVKPTSKPNVVQSGITDFAQSALGDVTYLQLPEVGRKITKGEIIGSVESVKAVSDIYAPVTGTVTRVNTDLLKDPSSINTSPFDIAWMLEIELSTESELKTLLNPGAYEAICV